MPRCVIFPAPRRCDAAALGGLVEYGALAPCGDVDEAAAGRAANGGGGPPGGGGGRLAGGAPCGGETAAAAPTATGGRP